MADLPKNPFMLLSMVNMKLRDRYPSLEALCDDLEEDQAVLEKTLEGIGYHYDREQNAFCC